MSTEVTATMTGPAIAAGPETPPAQRAPSIFDLLAEYRAAHDMLLDAADTAEAEGATFQPDVLFARLETTFADVQAKADGYGALLEALAEEADGLKGQVDGIKARLLGPLEARLRNRERLRDRLKDRLRVVCAELGGTLEGLRFRHSVSDGKPSLVDEGGQIPIPALREALAENRDRLVAAIGKTRIAAHLPESAPGWGWRATPRLLTRPVAARKGTSS